MVDLNNPTELLEYCSYEQNELAALSAGMIKYFDGTKPMKVKDICSKAVSYFMMDNPNINTMICEMDELAKELTEVYVELLKDCAMLEQLKKMNAALYASLAEKNEVLRKWLQDTENGPASDNALKQNLIMRLQGKISEVTLSLNISSQYDAQTVMLSSQYYDMAEKIQSTILSSIPLWKNQMVIELNSTKETVLGNLRKILA